MQGSSHLCYTRDMNKQTQHFLQLIGSIVICNLAGIVGAYATASSVSSWYLTLTKPAWNPPSWVFGPVWTLLYTMMGVSLYLIIREKKFRGITAWAFSIQLVLNTLWSFLFFGLQNPFLGLIEIIALWVAIVVTITAFWQQVRLAGILLLPYLAWVSFASYLNYTLYRLN